MAAPQVLQGTDSICFGVSSFVFTPQDATLLSKKDVHYCTFSNTSLQSGGIHRWAHCAFSEL
jgi:hypothetical protein